MKLIHHKVIIFGPTKTQQMIFFFERLWPYYDLALKCRPVFCTVCKRDVLKTICKFLWKTQSATLLKKDSSTGACSFTNKDTPTKVFSLFLGILQIIWKHGFNTSGRLLLKTKLFTTKLDTKQVGDVSGSLFSGSKDLSANKELLPCIKTLGIAESRECTFNFSCRSIGK